MIVLIGFMGAGKTSVGRELAPRLGLPFVDTDALIEQRGGQSIADLFVSRGERAFRELEREVVAEALAGPDAIVALGGGAVGDPITCTTLEWTDVVYLIAPYADSMRRIGADPGRPMLTATDPRDLYMRRQVMYERVADVTIDTTDRTVADVADEIGRRLAGAISIGSVDRVMCAPPSGVYPIIIGEGVAADLHRHIELGEDAETAFVITHPSLEAQTKPVTDALGAAGLRVVVEHIAEGEASKSLAVVEGLYERLAEEGAHRADLVVGVGGGVVTDVAGYVAATFNRGMPLLQVPTTLLGQVDAAIGGKTGVNLPQAKNLVGAFKQPIAVIADLEMLEALPDREIRAGLAEVVKYGFIADRTLLDLLEEEVDSIVARDPEILRRLITRSAGIKAEIVASDETERGRRAHLNYGHTFGHAFERVFGYDDIRHGEAVALGMMAAAHLAHSLGMIDEALVETHRSILVGLGLPTVAIVEFADIEAVWRRDKKYRKGVRFVLLEDVGRPRTDIEAPERELRWTIERMTK